MRRILILALLIAATARATRADDPPPAAPGPPGTGTPSDPAPVPVPVPKPPAKPAAPPARVGVRWEREFDAGLRRAVNEGRPVFVAVNALVDQGESGNTYLWREAYASKEMGAATRSFVNFVANPTAHSIDREPDGSETCRRYGVGTCPGHQDAMRWVLARLASADGAIISPYHAVLDPDGRIVYRGEYMQSCPTPQALESFLVQLSPSHALRDVWTSREAKLDALAKTAPLSLGDAAREWVATKDPMAVPGLVALFEQESNPFRRGAIGSAIAKAGASAVPVVEDTLRAATAAPDADWSETREWLFVALEMDASFGLHAVARTALRTKSRERSEWVWNLAQKVLGDASRDTIELARVEAVALLGNEGVGAELSSFTATMNWPSARLLRAALRSGTKVAAPLLDERDVVRGWLYESAAAGAVDDKDAAARALTRPEEEVRVAAALALRVAGDYRGVEILRAAIGDPVEGPEVRAVLSKLGGGDRGDDPEAWADVLTEPAKAGVK